MAILPLRCLDPGSREWEYLWEGVVEDIRTTLTYFRSFSVLSSSVSQNYGGRSDSIQALRTELGIDYALEGSVRIFYQTVVLNAQLVECGNGDRYGSARRRPVLGHDHRRSRRVGSAGDPAGPQGRLVP